MKHSSCFFVILPFVEIVGPFEIGLQEVVHSVAMRFLMHRRGAARFAQIHGSERKGAWCGGAWLSVTFG